MANWKKIGETTFTRHTLSNTITFYEDTTASVSVATPKILNNLRFIHGNKGAKYEPIKGASLEFDMIYDALATKISNAEPFKIRVDWERDGSLFFTGYVDKRFSDFAWYKGSKSLSVFAISPFKRLKGFELTISEVTTKRTLLEHFRFLADKTEIEHDVNVANTILEANTANIEFSSDKIRFKLSAFGDYPGKSAFEMLEKLCKAFSIEGFFSGGDYWFVNKFAVSSTGTYSVIDKITPSDTKTSSTFTNVTESITPLQKPKQSLQSEIQPYGVISFEYPFRQTLKGITDLQNTGLSSSYSFTDRSDWELKGDAVYATFSGDNIIRISTETASDTNLARQRAKSIYISDDSISITFNCGLVTDGASGGTYTYDLAVVKIIDLQSGAVTSNTISFEVQMSAGSITNGPITADFEHTFGDSIYAIEVDLIYDGSITTVTTQGFHKPLAATSEKQEFEFVDISTAESTNEVGYSETIRSGLNSKIYHRVVTGNEIESYVGGSWIYGEDYDITAASGRTFQEEAAFQRLAMFASRRVLWKVQALPKDTIQMHHINTADLPLACYPIYQEIVIGKRSRQYIEVFEIDDDTPTTSRKYFVD